MYYMSKQLTFFCFLLIIAHVANLKLKLETRSEGCSIKLRKMPENKIQAVSFISQVQAGLDDFDICNYFILTIFLR